MAALSRFSEDVSEEELNAPIQKPIPEKTKIARRISRVRKKNKLKYQFDSFTRRIVAGVFSFAISIGCLNKLNSIIIYQKKYCCSFVSSSEIST